MTSILSNTASLAEKPRDFKSGTLIGTDTVKEKATGQRGATRGKGGNIERVEGGGGGAIHSSMLGDVVIGGRVGAGEGRVDAGEGIVGADEGEDVVDVICDRQTQNNWCMFD